MDRNRISGHLWGNVVQAQHIHGDVAFNVKHRWWLTAIAVVIAVAAATLAGYWLTKGEIGRATPGPPAPKLVSKVSYYGCGKQHHEGDPAKADIARIKSGKDPAITHVPSSLLTLDVYAQNPSPQEILLVDLRMDVHKRSAPPTNGYIADSGPCGAVLEPRFFEADLSKDTVTAQPGEQGEQPVDFPYHVSQGDPELFRVHFAELTGYVEFALVLQIIVEGRDYEIRLDNDGRYYKATGTGNLPRYALNEQGDGLVPAT